ncbi:MarR family protein [Streptomyces sp. SolWspMP-sol7th]|nr:MarR family protein [Streptomyces sp. SolWspMP-sol7th]
MSTDPVASEPPGSPPRPSPAAVQASREVRAVISRLRRRILGASEAEDLTLGQSTALARLARETETPATAAGVTTSVLAAAEGVRHQSMTATVAALAARGLVVRTPDPRTAAGCSSPSRPRAAAASTRAARPVPNGSPRGSRTSARRRSCGR